MEATLPQSNIRNEQSRSFSRFKAGGIHLFLSISIAAIVVLLMLTLWYPRPYFEVAGAKQLLILIVGVDVVLGPLITLVIFNTKKKSLKFDLAVIALLQLAALGYGLNTMFQSRPAFVAFVDDRFELVAANEVYKDSLGKAKHPEYKSLPLTGPKIVGTTQPDSGSFESALAQVASKAGLGLQIFPEYYVPYTDVAKDAAAKAKPVTQLLSLKPEVKGLVNESLAKHGMKEGDVGYLTLRARIGTMTVLVNAKSGEILEILPITS